MIKELLIFLLLCRASKAGNDDDEISFKQKCLNDGGELLDRWNRICIPRDSLGMLLFNPETRDDEKTNIEVEVSKLQIKNIGDDTITLGMGMEMSWCEYRLQINVQGLPAQMISLSEEDQRQIWSPQIFIENNMVSMSMQGQQFVLLGGHEIFPFNTGTIDDQQSTELLLASKRFYLSSTVNCEMNFQTFPFDEHTCRIEVS